MGEIYRVTLEYDQPGSSQPNNVFHFENTGIASPTDTALIAGIDTWVSDEWYDTWAQMCSEDCELVLFNVDEMYADGTVKRNIGSEPVNLAGNLSGGVAPAGVAGYMLGYTGLPKQRGSKYVPGMLGSYAVDGEWSSTALTILAQLLAAYFLDIPIVTNVVLSPGILSKVLDQIVLFDGLGYVESIPAYQRRRKPNVGS